MRQWLVAAKKADFWAIAKEFHINPVTARLIRNREVVGTENIRMYLEGTLADLPNPHLLKDADRLTDLLCEKIRANEKIRVIGDYDVDGVTSTAMLVTALKRCGACVDAVIPHRIRDGYGMNLRLLEAAKAEHVGTILTCDNGISALAEIAWAKEQGMTVLITDHHAVPFTEENGVRTETTSLADAVVNPHQSACAYPYKELCGAGVAYLVIGLLYEKCGISPKEADELLELVGLATVCDVMALTGVNRILVREGLKRMQHTKNKGLRALIAACGIEGELSAYHFGFVLGPCINAAGRLETAELALRLLLTEQEMEGQELAERLVALNVRRKELTQQGVDAAAALCEREQYAGDSVLVLFLPDVHESVAGLIAGKLRERYDRPVFVLTRGDGCVKGSGRSTENYSMYENMCACAELFTKFGGHPMAAGLSMPEENVALFRKRINETCPLTAEELAPAVHIDMAMPLEYANAELAREFAVLAPFGKDNPVPLFADKDLSIRRMWRIGKNENVLRLTVRTESGQPVSVIYFGDIDAFLSGLEKKFGGQEVQKAYSGMENAITFAMTYTIKVNVYRGQEELQIEMKDYR